MRKTSIRQAGFTRPANTTNYTAGDAMGAGSGALDCILQFFKARPEEPDDGRVITARLMKGAQGSVTNDTFRLLLFRRLPATAPDENAAPTTSWIKEADHGSYVGMIDFETGDVHADCVMYEGQDYVPSSGIPFACEQSAPLYGILTALGAYNPASAEVFNVMLEIEH
tara:strand:- start:231 stop:734 length:504 start_codon:yes stop_codon:yes gene_type:complete